MYLHVTASDLDSSFASIKIRDKKIQRSDFE